MQCEQKFHVQWTRTIEWAESLPPLSLWQRYLVDDDAEGRNERAACFTLQESIAVPGLIGPIAKRIIPSLFTTGVEYEGVLVRNSEFESCPFACYTAIAMSPKELGVDLIDDDFLVLIGNPTTIAAQCVCLRGPDNKIVESNTRTCTYIHACIYIQYTHIRCVSNVCE